MASLPAVFVFVGSDLFFSPTTLAGKLHDVVCLQHHVASIPAVGNFQSL